MPAHRPARLPATRSARQPADQPAHQPARRRTLAAALALAALPMLLPSASPLAAQSAGREQTADQQVHHALSRLAFGPRPGDAERVRAMGVDRWIEQQLHPEHVDDAAMDQWLTRFPTLTMTGAQFVAKYPPPGQLQRQFAQRRPGAGAGDEPPRLSPEDSARLREAARATARARSELMTARVGRAVASERQLQEVLVDFWANHFNVFAGKPQTRYYLAEFERDAIRPHVLGNFRELLGAVAKSPAMLTYLDQAQSVADSGRTTLAAARTPQRGLATRGALRGNNRNQRAALERLTIGQLLDSGRLPEQARERFESLPAEQLQRVRAMTLAEAQQYLTALANNPNRSRGINENYARELMELHTLGVDGGYTQQDVMEVARALTGWTLSRGPAQGGSFLFRPEAHDAGAKVILGETFPAGRGQDEGERVLDLLASHPSTARFIATKLVRRFVSDEPPAALVERAAEAFLATSGDLREVMRTIVTSDEFFATDAYRAKVKTPFELVVSASRALGGQPDVTPLSAQLIARLGQPIYGRATPDGWPDTADEWINTGSILNRMNFGLAVGAGRLPGARLAQWSTARELAPQPPEQQVDGLVKALLGGDVSTETREILLTGRNPLLARAPSGSDSLFRDTDDNVDDDNDDAAPGMMAPPAVSPARPRPPAAPPAPRRGGQRNAMGALPELQGFPKLVGLAIGAPEFQRR